MFPSIEGFVKGKIKDFKQKILKIDADKDGKSDVIERLDEAEAATEQLSKFFGRFKASHYEIILAPLHAKFPAEFSEEEVKEAAKNLESLPLLLDAVNGGLDKLEAELQA